MSEVVFHFCICSDQVKYGSNKGRLYQRFTSLYLKFSTLLITIAKSGLDLTAMIAIKHLVLITTTTNLLNLTKGLTRTKLVNMISELLLASCV